METVMGSGLADIADHEQGPVILVNPAGEGWTAEDAASYLAVKDMFSDGTGTGYNAEGDEGRSPVQVAEDGTETPGLYPGTCTRMIIFADGAGADFAYEYLAPGVFGAGQYSGNAVWKPVGMFLLNAADETQVDLKGVVAEEYAHIENDAARPVPAVIVNGSDQVKAAFADLEDESYYQIVESEAQNLAQAKAELLAAYDSLLEHHMTRDMGEGVTLLPLHSAEQLGMLEEKGSFTSEKGTEIVYYQYLPEGYESLEEGTLPVVFGFHGGGNDAEMFVWSSGWAEVAADNDFMLVSVDKHDILRSEDEPAIALELIDFLKEKYPMIDTSRLYATGFSMGSMTSGYLGYNFDDVFAAIAPINGVSFETPAHGYIVPTFYNGGENSHFNLPFMMEGARAEVPTTNVDSRPRYLALFVNNKVMTQEEADAFEWPELDDGFIASFTAGDPKYGVEADEVVEVECDTYYGVNAVIRYYNSDDGNCYTVLSTTNYAGHEPIWEIAEYQWDFMSRFSRNEDGTLTIIE
jgi:hypothetical protein